MKIGDIVRIIPTPANIANPFMKSFIGKELVVLEIKTGYSEHVVEVSYGDRRDLFYARSLEPIAKYKMPSNYKGKRETNL